jgi:hypothetical protein
MLLQCGAGTWNVIRAQFAESKSWVSAVLSFRVCFEVMVVRLEFLSAVLLIQIV